MTNIECKHKWKIIEIHEGVLNRFFEKGIKNKVFILQCNVCGDIKQKWVKFPYMTNSIK